MKEIIIFWFRRDLRLHDNCALFHALKQNKPVLPVFIFDKNILQDLEDKDDARVHFIHETVRNMDSVLRKRNAGILVASGYPDEIFKNLINKYNITDVYTNHDYEPQAINRDENIKRILEHNNISFHTFKDQVIFEKSEILSRIGTPYRVYTPYRKKWQQQVSAEHLSPFPSGSYLNNLFTGVIGKIPELPQIGFKKSALQFPDRRLPEDIISDYDKHRDFPGLNGTSRLGIHLRFGTVSIRQMVRSAMELNETWLSELIWREFFMMILWQFPQVVELSFRREYDSIPWRNDEEEFHKWCTGQTGYPMVDAGMRELNKTGFMHNRARMIAASFLTKHLLIDWRKGEHYFARKLLDYELASNNGNWQWAAGCGCDAVPYFRIFNPTIQLKKFDPDFNYIKKWVPEYDQDKYPQPIVDHKFARERALSVYASALKKRL
jgi:deoxyribodipyrimidine photo-lyase